MKKWMHFSILLFGLLIILPMFANAQSKVVQMASLDWPPYSGASLPDQGANIKVAKAAFAAMGYELKVEFFTWARTIETAKSAEFAGYLPEYYAKEIEKEFIFSDPIGDSVLGLVERAEKPIRWKTIKDLKNAGPIGTVRGYVNTEEFDTLAAAGQIQVDPAKDDFTNLRKVIAARFDSAVIDKAVLRYILNTESEFKGKKNQLQFNAKPLEIKKLYLCFQNNPKGKQLVKIFNQGLSKINAEKITNEYFQTIFK